MQAGSDAISFYNDKKMEVSKGKFPEFFGCSSSNWSFEYLLIHLSVYFLRYQIPQQTEKETCSVTNGFPTGEQHPALKEAHSVQAASTATQHKFSHGTSGVTLSQSN